MSVMTVFDLRMGDAVTVTLPVQGKRDVAPEVGDASELRGLFDALNDGDRERVERNGFPMSVFQPGEALVVESINLLTAEVMVNRVMDGGRPVGYWIEAAFVERREA